jgi:hypothetical protein
MSSNFNCSYMGRSSLSYTPFPPTKKSSTIKSWPTFCDQYFWKFPIWNSRADEKHREIRILEWRAGLSDTNLKGTHPRTISARLSVIWFSGFRAEDLNVIFYQNMPNLHNRYKSAEKFHRKTCNICWTTPYHVAAVKI